MWDTLGDKTKQTVVPSMVGLASNLTSRAPPHSTLLLGNCLFSLVSQGIYPTLYPSLAQLARSQDSRQKKQEDKLLMRSQLCRMISYQPIEGKIVDQFLLWVCYHGQFYTGHIWPSQPHITTPEIGTLQYIIGTPSSVPRVSGIQRFHCIYVYTCLGRFVQID